MHTFTLIGLAAVVARGAFAACSGPLKIDDFSRWSSNTNSLGSWTSGKETNPVAESSLLIALAQMMVP
jgi:hypothetical protein